MRARAVGVMALIGVACGGGKPIVPTAPASEPVEAAPRNPVDYLLIGPRALVAAAAPLVALRERQGHGVEVIELESFGVYTRETVREAIAARAAAVPGLRFALLLGDPESGGVPGFPRESSFGEWFLTDLPYAEVGGERVLRVGRVPARTPAEVEAVARKIVRYETEPVRGGWQRRINMFAGPAKFGIVVDALIERAVTAILEQVPYDFDVNVTFAKPESPYAYRLDRLTGVISEELGRGSLVTVYTGHGLSYALDTVSWRGQSYEIGRTVDLAPVRIPHGSPFFISLTCLTGAYGLPYGQRSLAEEMVLNPEGPVAVFAASASSHPVANVVLGRGFLDALFGPRAETIGDAIAATRAQLLSPTKPAYQLVLGESGEDEKALWRMNAEMYNLFGDPATRPRYPEAATASIPAARARGGETTTVALTTEAIRAGNVTLTLELQRSDLRGPFVSGDELERLEREAALEAMSANHARANDRVLVKLGAVLEAGRAEVRLPLPKGNPGRYAIKALIEGDGRVAAAHTFIDVD